MEDLYICPKADVCTGKKCSHREPHTGIESCNVGDCLHFGGYVGFCEKYLNKEDGALINDISNLLVSIIIHHK